MNTTLGTISPVLSKLLLTLFKWILIVCQEDVADVAESLKDLSVPEKPSRCFVLKGKKITPMHL